jgi:hypothetical protein
MTASGWDHAALVRISGQSSSVVSQWLGQGSKEIKTIAKIEAAVAIERASGYSAVWVATGKGPKHVDSAERLVAREPQKPYFSTTQVLEQVQLLLARVPADRRAAVAETLAGWAREGGAEHWRHMLETLLAPPEKQQRRA